MALQPLKVLPGTVLGFVSSKNKTHVGTPLMVSATQELVFENPPKGPLTKTISVGNVTLGKVPTVSKKGAFTRSFKITKLPAGLQIDIQAFTSDGRNSTNEEIVILKKTEGQQVKLSFDS